MYHGKYLKPKPVRSAKRNGLLLISLVLLLTITVGGSIAFLIDITNQVENTFTPAQVSIDPTEATTPDSKSDIRFQNSGDVPVYVRATLVIYWTDTIDGVEQIIAQPSGASVSDRELLNNGWFVIGDIYYYNLPVASGDSTETMLDKITVVVPEGCSATCHIDVRAEAIQADPSTAVENAWTDVDVENGKLKPHTAG